MLEGERAEGRGGGDVKGWLHRHFIQIAIDEGLALGHPREGMAALPQALHQRLFRCDHHWSTRRHAGLDPDPGQGGAQILFRRRRSEEHTSELQSLMRTSYAVFCLKKKT